VSAETHPLRRRPELGTILALGVAAAAGWAFLALAGEVREGDVHELDRALLLALRTPGDPSDPVGPRWFEEMARDFTALGGTAVTVLVTVAATLFLWSVKSRAAAALLVAAVGGGEVLSLALKAAFGRPRPDLVPHATHVYTASFPSGHAMMSAVAWLTIGAIVARVRPEKRAKAVVAATVVVVTMLVGASRVYLGVHWPTDVLAGWAAGASWAALCWVVADALRKRGKLKDDPPPG
jgi:undecaprenyl-diphosphatase